VLAKHSRILHDENIHFKHSSFYSWKLSFVKFLQHTSHAWDINSTLKEKPLTRNKRKTAALSIESLSLAFAPFYSNCLMIFILWQIVAFVTNDSLNYGKAFHCCCRNMEQRALINNRKNKKIKNFCCKTSVYVAWWYTIIKMFHRI
jgi:hypothetical protein